MTIAPADVFTRSQRRLLAATLDPELHRMLIAFGTGRIPAEPPDGAVLPDAAGTRLWVRDDDGTEKDESHHRATFAAAYAAEARWITPGAEAACTWPVAWFKGAVPVVLHTLARCPCPDRNAAAPRHASPGCPWGRHPAPDTPAWAELVPASARITVNLPGPEGHDGPPPYDGPVHAAHEKLETGHWPATDAHGEPAELYVLDGCAAAIYHDEDEVTP